METKSGNLKRHNRSKHEGMRYPCDYSSRWFEDRVMIYDLTYKQIYKERLRFLYIDDNKMTFKIAK